MSTVEEIKTETISCESTKSKQVSKYITLFILILVFVWVILFTWNPTSVQKVFEGAAEPVENAQPDPVKCFWGGAIVSLIVIILIGVFTMCSKR